MDIRLKTVMDILRELYKTEEKQVVNVIDSLYWEFDVASKCPNPVSKEIVMCQKKPN